MQIRYLEPGEINDWVQSLIKATPVYGPVRRTDQFVFDRLEKPDDLALEYDLTVLSPKKYFQPQREVLMTFDREGRFHSEFEVDPFVLFGVHPYDFESIRQLDLLFSDNRIDRHYMARREAATIIVLDPIGVGSDGFAGCMGTATAEKMEGFDILLTGLDDGNWLVDIRTGQGLACAETLGEGRAVDDWMLAAREKVWGRNKDAWRRHELAMAPEDIPALLERSKNHPLWEEMADKCHSCGSCNLVCPTCYCFDVRDELDWNLQSGQRVRTWDGCMLTQFASVAGDHNFREQRAARYRHRYYRKGKYIPDMIGSISCVGCGRCTAACTAGIANPVEIFNRLWEEAS